jgi:hypothetical protein
MTHVAAVAQVLHGTLIRCNAAAPDLALVSGDAAENLRKKRARCVDLARERP